MDTLETAIDCLRHNQTPFWWVSQGNGKLAQNLTETDIEQSISRFRDASRFWPTGSLKLECSDKVNDRTGSFKLNFSKGVTTGQQPTAMTPSNNAYGIADSVLEQIRKETRQTLLFEQMHQQFGPLADMVKDLVKRMETVEKLLGDEDQDGTPDLFQMVNKASDLAESGQKIKRVFEGGKLFG